MAADDRTDEAAATMEPTDMKKWLYVQALTAHRTGDISFRHTVVNGETNEEAHAAGASWSSENPVYNVWTSASYMIEVGVLTFDLRSLAEVARVLHIDPADKDDAALGREIADVLSRRLRGDLEQIESGWRIHLPAVAPLSAPTMPAPPMEASSSDVAGAVDAADVGPCAQDGGVPFGC